VKRHLPRSIRWRAWKYSCYSSSSHRKAGTRCNLEYFQKSRRSPIV